MRKLQIPVRRKLCLGKQVLSSMLPCMWMAALSYIYGTDGTVKLKPGTNRRLCV